MNTVYVSLNKISNNIMKVTHITNVEQFAELTKQGLCIVDYGAKWCGPCRRIAPEFDRLSEQFPDITFLKIDVDEVPELCTDIACLPTFVFLSDGFLIRPFTVNGASVDNVQLNLKRLITGSFEKPAPILPEADFVEVDLDLDQHVDNPLVDAIAVAVEPTIDVNENF
jgi:thioredoxin 1